MVLAVVFTLVLKDEASEQRFLDAFAAVQQQVVHNEPGTLTYELHHIIEDGKPAPLKYVVLERYSDQRSFEEIHSKSAPFQALFALLPELQPASTQLVVLNNAASQAALDTRPQVWTHDNIQDPLLKKGVLVFCGARLGAKPAYAAEAKALAKYIVEQAQQPVVYGGGTVGLMGAVAQETKALGGKVISIIPSSLCPREVSGEILGDLVYYTSTMSERKSIMFAHADTVIALPGGVGTFDELLEVITLYQLNAYRPKVGIVNVDGFFDPFLGLLRHLVAEGFLVEDAFDYFVVRPTAVEVMEALKNYELPATHVSSPLTWTARP